MLYLLIVLAALSRLLPHPPNFAPIGAIGLVCGAYLDKRRGGAFAWGVPLAAVFLSDLLLASYNPITRIGVYAGLAVSALIGRALLYRAPEAPKRSRMPLRIAGSALLSATAFFLLSNFGVWLSGGYGHTAGGLLTCYTMALPFFGNTLAGDLFYAGVLFGGLALAERIIAARRMTQAA